MHVYIRYIIYTLINIIKKYVVHLQSINYIIIFAMRRARKHTKNLYIH